MSNSYSIGPAHSFIFSSLRRLVDILSTRDPMTGDLLLTVKNCIDRVKLTLYVMITHLIYFTTMSFVTVVTTPSFSTIPTSMCMPWPLFLLKVFCSSNWRCHDNVSNIVIMTLIANTVLLPLLRLSTPLRRISSMAITNSCAAGREMPRSKNYRNIYHA